MGFDLGGIARSRLMQFMFGSQRHTCNPPTSNQYELFYLLNHIHNHQFKQEKNSEPPAPAPAAAPPAEVPKAAAAVDAAATKKKSRQSLSISKSAQEAMQHNMEDKQPAADATAPPAAAPAASGGYQGLPQIGSPPSALRELPALRDAPPNKREELFKLKLQLCGVIFSFDDPTSDKRGKVCLLVSETSVLCTSKRKTLNIKPA